MADPNPARILADPEDPITATVSGPYAPLLDVDLPAGGKPRRPFKGFLVILSVLLFVGLLMTLIGETGPGGSELTDLTLNAPAEFTNISAQFLEPASRGPSAGVSEKSFRLHSGEKAPFPWSNTMLSWQRTAYHFQPEKNWMNGRVIYIKAVFVKRPKNKNKNNKIFLISNIRRNQNCPF